MMVVALRENSRIRGLTSLDSATNMVGSISWTSSRTRRSWTGFRNDHSSETAIAATPWSTSWRMESRAESSSSATTMLPSRSMRSITSSARFFGISACPFSCPCTFCSWSGERPR